ncbi:hypothetical protein C1H46_045137 [Malus baccata]|uniref:Uncharacterized protein n=1 Tax=Malus baccata TaxID=106549 RepID=A0A540K542_MALBA|nr:hypothetical protein C1H46_045137 [Malus baccata]
MLRRTSRKVEGNAKKTDGPGRNQSMGGRVEKSKGFAPKSLIEFFWMQPVLPLVKTSTICWRGTIIR